MSDQPRETALARRSEQIAAGVVILFGVVVGAIAYGYPMGSLARPGPGFGPFLVACLIVGLGAAIMVEVHTGSFKPFRMPMRPLLATSAGILAFALLAERVGFMPATVALVLVSGLGERRLSYWPLVGLAVFMAVFGSAVFIWGLGVPLKSIGLQ
ncbi:tripartite tricarboxylate transporter TctB family protein [Ferrovibrio xuzhouensis]|uniref:Tripartite tricarboxylate transporter TctB family protein n=1 Tax=Ferrovibrio xuzhouensis TaxID=1576914 RepID=A0ABV7VDZ2_9PROT